jgi:hypothetical protein
MATLEPMQVLDILTYGVVEAAKPTETQPMARVFIRATAAELKSRNPKVIPVIAQNGLLAKTVFTQVGQTENLPYELYVNPDATVLNEGSWTETIEGAMLELAENMIKIGSRLAQNQLKPTV